MKEHYLVRKLYNHLSLLVFTFTFLGLYGCQDALLEGTKDHLSMYKNRVERFLNHNYSASLSTESSIGGGKEEEKFLEKKEVQALEETINQLKEDYDEVKQALEKAQETWKGNLENQKILKALQDQLIKAYKDKIEKLEKEVNDLKPKLKKLQYRNSDLTSEKSLFETVKTTLQYEKRNLNTRAEKLQRQKNELNKKIRKLQSEAETLTDKNRELKSNVDNISNSSKENLNGFLQVLSNHRIAIDTLFAKGKIIVYLFGHRDIRKALFENESFIIALLNHKKISEELFNFLQKQKRDENDLTPEEEKYIKDYKKRNETS